MYCCCGDYISWYLTVVKVEHVVVNEEEHVTIPCLDCD